VRYKQEVHAAEHAAIIDEETWRRTQATLARNGRTGGVAVRNKYGALLKGLLRCAPCDCAMTPTHTTKKGVKRYRYYACSSAQRRGRSTCPSGSVPAGEIERFVLEQVRSIGRDRRLLAEVVARADAQAKSRAAELGAERRSLKNELARLSRETGSLSAQPRSADRLAELLERVRIVEARASELDAELEAQRATTIDGTGTAASLASFDPVWEALAPRERARLVQLLVERVDYDGAVGKVAITFHPAGIRSLAEQISNQERSRA
jgi:site-specific DNA recombinase